MGLAFYITGCLIGAIGTYLFWVLPLQAENKLLKDNYSKVRNLHKEAMKELTSILEEIKFEVNKS